ncbi:MAG: glycosyltransferase family 9 protein [Bacteroidia bacterium]|nr:glycosyltransferase family 9 protein [Bacteroidia bacterium]
MRSNNILLIRLSAMGDVAMTAPIITDLCTQYPDKHFVLLTTPMFGAFYTQLDNLEILDINVKKQYSTPSKLWKLARLLNNKYHFAHVIDLHDVLRTKLLRKFIRLVSLFSTKNTCIDKGRKEKNQLLSASYGEKHQLTKMTDRYMQTLAKANFPINETHFVCPTLPIPQVDTIPLSKNGEKWIGIAPFAQHFGKVYPLLKMHDVVELLAKEQNIRLFIFGGGPKEKQIAEDWAKDSDNIQSAIGIMKLDKELALISNLDIMLSMDSSAMHMASLFGVRTVSIWGATHPYAGFLGYGQKMEDVIQRDDLPCRPCSIFGNKPCSRTDFSCMNIEPKVIAEKVLSRL